mmetsp:Transcript_28248/g.43951  ORF Transcript_28248/g.43951 Transcript_28248/m.43951 type:complete len:636 (-) Transcript_28248:181-2088(-)|eukprot:CAMPEP_0196817172 /NCGR_PEP_ID=MMETSP1362-20130617/59153_1 /TAXON_ID=163516 /ORGANISM="Leptocylindrus danicus, Strain CCMP1856" /LENGTH=635 /DNA_ID=CAMNT_0042194765 /DNA_START=472 /DNA_END=2379 /DNA_ORIENTATION=-
MVWDMGLQNVVNRWVSVNKKHVQFPNAAQEELDRSSGRGGHGTRERSDRELHSSPSGISTETKVTSESTATGGHHHVNNNSSSMSRQQATPRAKLRTSSKTKLRSLSKIKASSSNVTDSSASNSHGNASSSKLSVSDHSSSAAMRKQQPAHAHTTHNLNSSQHSASAVLTTATTIHDNANGGSMHRGPRRLERTNSNSDLMREAALANAAQHRRPVSSNNKSSSRHHHAHHHHPHYVSEGLVHSSMANSVVSSNMSVGSASVGSISGVHSVGSGSMTLQQMNAMRWVNEGYDRAQKKKHSKKDGRYLNAAYSPKHYNVDGRSSERSVGSISAGDGSRQKPSVRRSRLQNHLREQHMQVDHHGKHPNMHMQLQGTRTFYPAPPSPGRYAGSDGQRTPSPSITPPPANGEDGAAQCVNCLNNEGRLYMLEEEMRFLRSVALRSENCDVCNDEGSMPISATMLHVEDVQESVALTKASQRLSEITSRHKRQIEQMSREKGRWQNDMHLKLSKFSLMCKDLNEDSAIIKEDLSNTRSELANTKLERDSLASTLEDMKIQLKEYQNVLNENEQLRKELRERDEESTKDSNSSHDNRDAIIADLTKQLEKANSLLDNDRLQNIRSFTTTSGQTSSGSAKAG